MVASLYTAQTRTHPECILFTGQHQHATIHTMKSKNMKMRMYLTLIGGLMASATVTLEVQ